MAAAAFSTALSADALTEDRQKVIKKFPSKNGKVVVELRSHPESTLPTSATVHFPFTGKRVPLADSGTYIMGVQLSDNGDYIVLQQHVSSGGWFDVFERNKQGYRRLFGNGYAWKEVCAGRVEGFSEADLPEIPGRNVFSSIHLERKPERIVFTIEDIVEFTFSLQKMRITEWQRSLLDSEFFKEGTTLKLSLDILSGERGIALQAVESSEAWEKRRKLAVFPMPKDERSISGEVPEFMLETGKIELKARKVKNGSEDEGSEWEVTVSGSGQEFTRLREQLATLQERYSTGGEQASQWPTATTFVVSPFPFGEFALRDLISSGIVPKERLGPRAR